MFYADRKEGHSQFMFKTNLELTQTPDNIECDKTCMKCDGTSEFQCTECDTTLHRLFNSATGQCQCRNGYKEKDGKCEVFSFAYVNYDKYSLERVQCYDMCEEKVKFNERTHFSLRVTTKAGVAPNILASEDFDHPALCG
jgi:hypothetical protein